VFNDFIISVIVVSMNVQVNGWIYMFVLSTKQIILIMIMAGYQIPAALFVAVLFQMFKGLFC